jgi:hypothetical protein
VQFTVARVLAESSTVEEASGRLLEQIAEGLDWELGAIWWRDESQRVLRFAGGWNRSRSEVRFLTESRTYAFSAASFRGEPASGRAVVADRRGPTWPGSPATEEVRAALAPCSATCSG